MTRRRSSGPGNQTHVSCLLARASPTKLPHYPPSTKHKSVNTPFLELPGPSTNTHSVTRLRPRSGFRLWRWTWRGAGGRQGGGEARAGLLRGGWRGGGGGGGPPEGQAVLLLPLGDEQGQVSAAVPLVAGPAAEGEELAVKAWMPGAIPVQVPQAVLAGQHCGQVGVGGPWPSGQLSVRP